MWRFMMTMTIIAMMTTTAMAVEHTSAVGICDAVEQLPKTETKVEVRYLCSRGSLAENLIATYGEDVRGSEIFDAFSNEDFCRNKLIVALHLELSDARVTEARKNLALAISRSAVISKLFSKEKVSGTDTVPYLVEGKEVRVTVEVKVDGHWIPLHSK